MNKMGFNTAYYMFIVIITILYAIRKQRLLQLDLFHFTLDFQFSKKIICIIPNLVTLDYNIL